MIQDIYLVNSDTSIQEFQKKFSEGMTAVPIAERFVAIDTEFIGERSTSPVLCLVQIATANEVFIIDPIALDITFLKNLLEDINICKVIHSAVQDVKVIGPLKNVYDTQLYEMLLSSHEFESYRHLVFKYCGKHLNKSCCLSNWKKRPLSQKQLKYAAEDVTFLREIYKKQKIELEKLGRIGWLDPEMKHLEKLSATNSADIEKLDNSDNPHAEIQQKLTEWAKNRADEKHLSIENIVSEQSISKISRKGRSYIEKLLGYRGLHNKDLRDFLMFAKSIVPDCLDNYEQRYDIYHDNVIIGALKLILEMTSKSNNIAQSLIATTSDLKNFIRKDPFQNRCLQGWRKDIFGQYALDFLQKKISIALNEENILAFRNIE